MVCVRKQKRRTHATTRRKMCETQGLGRATLDSYVFLMDYHLRVNGCSRAFQRPIVQDLPYTILVGCDAFDHFWERQLTGYYTATTASSPAKYIDVKLCSHTGPCQKSRPYPSQPQFEPQRRTLCMIYRFQLWGVLVLQRRVREMGVGVGG